MATLTIRNLDAALKERLRVRITVTVNLIREARLPTPAAERIR